MTELERRALLGDKQAQEECTDKGIVLPCPKCFKPVTVHGPEDWEPTFHDPDSGGDPYEFDCKCGVAFSTYKYDFKEALADWNTRPAPPLGRCIDCANVCEVGGNLVTCDIFERDMMPDDFCSQFEAREMHNRERLHQD